MAELASGRPYPLGAHWDGAGVNFAVYADGSDPLELGLGHGAAIDWRRLPAIGDGVRHGYLPGAEPGLRYVFRRSSGGAGHDPRPPRPLLDPAARALAGRFDWSRLDDPHSVGGLQAVVVDPRFDWRDDRRPQTPWSESLLYEIHVRGATIAHPEVAAEHRGRYLGLAEPAMLAHYRRLGITALCLMPVQAFIDEQRLARAGLTNYWGYNPIGFFVPESRYAGGDGQQAVDEFKTMVRALHAAGIEVIVDVVFNHTAETDAAGPTLSWRGLADAAYYRRDPADPARYDNPTGCGNAMQLAHPRTLQQVMDALRYWAGEMHVDGFRFDLAATLTRDSAFLEVVAQEPLLASLKLIAEPWDIGPDGYRLGRFPAGWSEWNDRFRDDLRRYWLTGTAGAGALAQRLAGSSELFGAAGRKPQAGINYVATHDGFTLRDLVSYRERHNAANGEGNRDGHPDNHSVNCGVEGETDDPAVAAERTARQRALLATVFVAQGVPLLQAGDEFGRTQHGNNNAYCQDNPTTWLDWARADRDLADFVAACAALRRDFPQLRREDWLRGEAVAAVEVDALWWHPDGRPMQAEDWHGDQRGFALRLAGVEAGAAAVLLLCQPDATERRFVLPAGEWRLQLSSAPQPAGCIIEGDRPGCRLRGPALALLADGPAPATRPARNGR